MTPPVVAFSLATINVKEIISLTITYLMDHYATSYYEISQGFLFFIFIFFTIYLIFKNNFIKKTHLELFQVHI